MTAYVALGLVAVPDSLRTTLVQAEKVIGFEHFPGDIFHPEPTPAPQTDGNTRESHIVTTFLQSILDRSLVHVRYGSPYHLSGRQETAVIPLGLFWDRNHWYLVGKKRDGDAVMRLWRADRVISLREASEALSTPHAFDIQNLLGHRWLRSAMDQWQRNAPVTIRLTRLQAERLQRLISSMGMVLFFFSMLASVCLVAHPVEKVVPRGRLTRGLATPASID